MDPRLLAPMWLAAALMIRPGMSSLTEPMVAGVKPWSSISVMDIIACKEALAAISSISRRKSSGFDIRWKAIRPRTRAARHHSVLQHWEPTLPIEQKILVR
ncbi:hypothetical protein [Janthinobacterium lividum]|uniref:hypothetical protein n=1 Tax=Janthinobacterium lividum TaxID=29581 RepID=UPI0009300F4B|nr:hypothetical protein [Janthinobacterium lividum]